MKLKVLNRLKHCLDKNISSVKEGDHVSAAEMLLMTDKEFQVMIKVVRKDSDEDLISEGHGEVKLKDVGSYE